jgi:hypothetical protein
MKRPFRLGGLAGGFLGAGLLLATGPAGAQECAEGRISYVFIDNHEVFDTDDMEEGAPFRWAYDVANSLHVKTAEDFIQKELLFGENACYDSTLLEESERLLRRYPFIAQADVFGLRQPDGTWHVVVDTQDEWTTKLNVNVALDRGLEFRGVSLTEENLLGQGYLVGLFFREREEEKDLGGRIYTPRIFGTRLDAALQAGTTRRGHFLEQEFFYPFVGEVGRLGFRELFVHRDDIFAYSRGDRSDPEHIILPVAEQRIEVTVAGRLGRPGNLTILGLGFSNETLDFPGYPGEVEITNNGNFDDTRPATPEVTDALRTQTLHTGGTRFNLLFGQRNIRFVQRTGLDALRGVQDVEVGTDVALTVGRSVGALSTNGDQPDDLYTRLHVFGGFAPDHVTVNGAFSLEGRRLFAGGEGEGWEDVLAELDALVYWQPDWVEGFTFFARLAAAGGWEMGLPFQLTLGGEDGVRGYHADAYPGARRVILTLEDRIYVKWPFPDLLDLGFTLFADAGHVWAGDVPFGRDSGLKASVGGGLRIGFPAGTRGVVRVDAALPIHTGLSLGDAILRISLVDLLGLAGGLEDRQMRRSRRVTVGPDRFTRHR